MIRKTLTPLVVFLVVVLAGSWVIAQESDLPPCTEDQNKRFHNCFGTYTFADGDKYVGEFRDNKQHGQGTYTYANGGKYVGEWRDAKRHGHGTAIYADGNKYVGEWRDDKRHGHGTAIYADGGKYIGEFKDNKLHGHGTRTDADGGKYIGEFKDNKLHGHGTIIFTDGQVLEGLWENDEFISSSQPTSHEDELFVRGDLVKDLRSGKSNVRASLDSYNNSLRQDSLRKYFREEKSKPDYRAIVAWKNWNLGISKSGSAEEAIHSLLQHCKERNNKCRIYSVGDTIVEGHSQAELADVIEAYQLEVSGSKYVKCKYSNGDVFTSWGSCQVGKQITKAEYDRLKNKKKDSASTTEPDTASSGDDPLEAKLERLKKLLEMGLITEEEAAAKRAKLLEDL